MYKNFANPQLRTVYYFEAKQTIFQLKLQGRLMAKQITLIPLDDATSNIRTYSPGTIVKIGRCDGNLIKISDRRVARNHCEIWFDGTSWVIANLSRANNINVNNQILKGFMKKKLTHKSVLILSTNYSKQLGFEVQITEKTHQKVSQYSSATFIEMEPPKIKKSFEETLFENLQCPICLNILCQPVMAQRCSHTFCGGCLSQWFRSQHNYNCPFCRKQIDYTNPDRKIEEIANKYMEEYPCKKRDPQEVAQLRSANFLQSEFQIFRPTRTKVEQGVPISTQPFVFNGHYQQQFGTSNQHQANNGILQSINLLSVPEVIDLTND